MVLTDPVGNGSTTQRNDISRYSRRSLLRMTVTLALAGSVVPLTACDLFDGEPDPDPQADPLAPMIATALDLATRCQAIIAAHPDRSDLLAPISAGHLAHAQALAAVTGATAPGAAPAGSPGPETADAAAALAALRAGREQAAGLCLSAPAERAALVGSIAAALATYVEALK